MVLDILEVQYGWRLLERDNDDGLNKGFEEILREGGLI
jgi:hypothetical protein